MTKAEKIFWAIVVGAAFAVGVAIG
jgi:hypothetical protein